MLAWLICSALALQAPKDDSKVDLEGTKLLIYDADKGVTLRIRNDGKVELTVREDDPAGGKTTKVISEASAAEFRKKHPDLVRKYELGRHLGTEPRALRPDDFDEWWKALKKGVPDLGPMPGLDQPYDEEFQRFMDEQKQLFGRMRRQFRAPGADPMPRETPPGQAPVPGGRELGIKVDAVGDTLRDQLSLRENEGVLVAEVKPGSLAEKAGLKEHDLLLKLDGKAVTDRWQFRADILVALGRPEFQLELLRGGKRETVKVKTSVRKDE